MAVQLLEPMVELMCLRAKGQFCTDRVRRTSLFSTYTMKRLGTLFLLTDTKTRLVTLDA